MKALSDMDISKVEELLTELKENLDDLEEERKYVLGQTGRHVPGKTVRQFEAEVSGLKNMIEEAEKVLLAKKADKQFDMG